MARKLLTVSCMGLTEYRRKRNFKVTAEPRGRVATSKSSRRYVIQKHAASHLHYDLRLELDGVLKSWAVPKGPSLDPAQKRLAMEVEDHPIDYGNFEGIIPEGEYGGGTVMLWDQGRWEPEGDVRRDYKAGRLKFSLEGEKLHGKWMLVRRGGQRADADERHWFFFKERDEYADPEIDVTAKLPLSVATERDLDEIASDADAVWGKNGRQKKSRTKAAVKRRTAKTRPKSGKTATRKRSRRMSPAQIERALKSLGAKKAPMPRSPSVELATLVAEEPDGDDWLHEIKLDGYRMLCRISGGSVRFISRNGHDWTSRFTGLKEDAAKLPATDALIDGEVVVLDDEGRSSFQTMQNAFKGEVRSSFYFYVFDLLYLNGFDLRPAPIEKRKAILQQLVSGDDDAIRYSDHVVGHGPATFREASRLGLERIISKRLSRPYVGGRGLDWVKVKASQQEEFVIGGFTKPSGSREEFGALLLGHYDPSGDLRYAGRVGTGFSATTLADVSARLNKLIAPESSFSDLSGRTGEARGVTWVKPKLVGQVSFSHWTEGGHLRHPVFLGLREDKPARQVRRDAPVSTPEVTTMKTTAKRRTASATDSESVVAGVALTHPDKVLYPDDGITKLDLARYYEQAAEWMLPHVKNRLMSLVRCPKGSGTKCFFQKHPGEGPTGKLRRYPVKESDGVEEYLAVRDLAGLITLVPMGVLEIHLWGSTADRYEKPDRLIFDLDPDPAVKWPAVVQAAREVRALLDELGLVSFLKTTGGKGLHIVVPIERRLDWDEAKAFCRAVADFLVAAAPNRYIAKMSKAARKGKIFVDYLRNDRGATAIAPYSTRAKPGATVSVPIDWKELSSRLTSDHFTIANLPQRLARLKNDPWAEIGDVRQSVTATMLKSLQSL